MKKYIIYLLTSAAFLLTGCEHETKDIFDRSASERIEQAMQNSIDVLCAAENGWVLEYYPDKSQSFGGYIFLMKFTKDGMVVIATSDNDPDVTETSQYEMYASQGPVLAFCTYNSLFHKFSDPSTTEGDGRRYGYRGDFELVVMEADRDRVRLRGTKTGNDMVMTPLAADVSWEDYLRQVDDIVYMVAAAQWGAYIVNVDGSPVFEMTMGTYKTLSYTNPDDEDGGTSGIAYVYTDKGLDLYKPIEFKGYTIQSFTWDPIKEVFVSDDYPSITLQGSWPYGWMRYYDLLGTWDFYAALTNTGSHTKFTITISQDIEFNTFTVTGLRYPFTANYASGGITIGMAVEVGSYTHSDGITYPVSIYLATATGLITGSTNWFYSTFSGEDDSGNPRLDLQCTSASYSGFGFFYNASSWYYLQRYFYPYMIKQ